MSGPRLRFAMVTTFYPPYNFGGDGIYVQGLARALARRGHDVEVIHDTDAYRSLTGTNPDDPDPDPYGVIVHRLASRLPGLSALAVHQLGRPAFHAKRLNTLLADRFDVIHFHNVSLVGGPGAWRYGRAVKIHTAHEHWLACPSHILWRDNKELCDEKRCLTCVLRHRRPPQLWRAGNLLERLSTHVDRFVTLSQSAKTNHQMFGFGAPMTVVPSFLPDELDAADAYPVPERGKQAQGADYFLFVGRLEASKGAQDVIPHFGADHPCELWIAGKGNFEPELRRLARGNKRVRFLGHVTMANLRALYRDAIAVITPSRCYEVFPMVALEAFREGTPIISRALGPYPEIVSTSGAGLLFNSDAELKDAIDRLATAPEFARSLGRNGLEAIKRYWSEDAAIAAYYNVIEQVAAKKGLDALKQKLKRLQSAVPR